MNDVRKYIKISKPVFLYGYNRRYIYYEAFDKYFENFCIYHKKGASNIFASLIIVLNKVNDSYNIYDLGDHSKIRTNLLSNYKTFGLEKLDYEPAFFESNIFMMKYHLILYY